MLPKYFALAPFNSVSMFLTVVSLSNVSNNFIRDLLIIGGFAAVGVSFFFKETRSGLYSSNKKSFDRGGR